MNPHEDFDQLEREALQLVEEALALHELCTEIEGDYLVEFRRMRSMGMRQAPRHLTQPERKVYMEHIAAQAEAEYDKACRATQRAMEVLRLRRDQYGMVRSKMANNREEKGAVLRDGAYRGP